MSEIGEGSVYEQKLDTPLRGMKSNKNNSASRFFLQTSYI